jgi:hypothetical protein
MPKNRAHLRHLKWRCDLHKRFIATSLMQARSSPSASVSETVFNAPASYPGDSRGYWRHYTLVGDGAVDSQR